MVQKGSVNGVTRTALHWFRDVSGRNYPASTAPSQSSEGIEGEDGLFVTGPRLLLDDFPGTTFRGLSGDR
jgi:hypothetical protein